MPFLVLTMVIQVALVVHVMKTGRNTVWVFILLFAPVIGGLAYVIVELLPEWTGSRTGVKARRKLANLANPDRNLQSAERHYAVADTVQNAITLAQECMQKGRFEEATTLYQRALRGVHEDDPVLLFGLARARFGMGDAAGAVAALDLLKQRHPAHTSADAHLLYAKAKEALGDVPAAIEEFQALVRYFPGPEPACRLGRLLKAQGRADEARALFERVRNESRIAGRHYNELHREWVEMAQREL